MLNDGQSFFFSELLKEQKSVLVSRKYLLGFRYSCLYASPSVMFIVTRVLLQSKDNVCGVDAAFTIIRVNGTLGNTVAGNNRRCGTALNLSAPGFICSYLRNLILLLLVFYVPRKGNHSTVEFLRLFFHLLRLEKPVLS